MAHVKKIDEFLNPSNSILQSFVYDEKAISNNGTQIVSFYSKDYEITVWKYGIEITGEPVTKYGEDFLSMSLKKVDFNNFLNYKTGEIEFFSGKSKSLKITDANDVINISLHKNGYYSDEDETTVIEMSKEDFHNLQEKVKELNQRSNSNGFEFVDVNIPHCMNFVYGSHNIFINKKDGTFEMVGEEDGYCADEQIMLPLKKSDFKKIENFTNGNLTIEVNRKYYDSVDNDYIMDALGYISIENNGNKVKITGHTYYQPDEDEVPGEVGYDSEDESQMFIEMSVADFQRFQERLRTL